MSVAATQHAAAVQQQSCSRMKNLKNTHPSRMTYEYPSIIKLIDLKH